MKKIRLISLIAIAQLFVVSISAFDFSADNKGKTIYYNINDDKESVTVTFKDAKSVSYMGDIVIPETVKSGGKTYAVTAIGDAAFRNSIVTTVKMPEAIKSIGSSAFRGCKRLATITLPDSLETMGEYTFSTSSLDSITIPQKVKILPRLAFKGCDRIRKVTLPESLTVISDYAFMDCSRLKTVNMPDSLYAIQKSAFFNCYMFGPKLELKRALRSISLYAFGNCYSIKDVYSYSSLVIPVMSEKAFGDVYRDDLILYVGKGGIPAFKEMPGWKEFKVIKEFD